VDCNFFEDKAWEDERIHAKVMISITDEEMSLALASGEAFTTPPIQDSRYGVEFVVVVVGRRTGDMLLDLRKTRLIET